MQDFQCASVQRDRLRVSAVSPMSYTGGIEPKSFAVKLDRLRPRRHEVALPSDGIADAPRRRCTRGRDVASRVSQMIARNFCETWTTQAAPGKQPGSPPANPRQSSSSGAQGDASAARDQRRDHAAMGADLRSVGAEGTRRNGPADRDQHGGGESYDNDR